MELSDILGDAPAPEKQAESTVENPVPEQPQQAAPEPEPTPTVEQPSEPQPRDERGRFARREEEEAQNAPPQQSIAGTLQVYVFPAEGQDATQQSKDEAACYEWATQNTGVDPFAAQKQAEVAKQQAALQQQQAAKATQGAGAKGALGGAAAGALIGEIASNDAGEGAAWGAAAGAVMSRRRARHAEQTAQQGIEKQAEQAQAVTTEQIGGFKKAFAACVEGKKYIAK